MDDNPILWQPTPEQIARTRLHRFQAQHQAGARVDDYAALHRWSTAAPEEFWAALWQDAELVVHAPYTRIRSGWGLPGTSWFDGAQLNFAENLLRRRDHHPALIGESELGLPARVITYAELRQLVARAAAGLRECGVQRKDRVAAYLPNLPETIVAMLATASLGAVWSSCSPDFGVQGVVDRFAQLEPRVFLFADGYRYDGRTHSCTEKAAQILARLPSVGTAVRIPFLSILGQPPAPGGPPARSWEELLDHAAEEPCFEPVPFDHPLFVLYSSGTTGLPKAIVHGTGGPLLNFHKEHALHCDLHAGDVLCYFTTCGWMMWNWLAAGLLQGATVVCYDGSPFFPNDLALWRLVARHRVTHFGTSAKYLAVCQKRESHPAAALPELNQGPLRCLLSTGSPLHPAQFDWVYQEVARDLNLASISGGTDILGCFVLGSPTLPVRRGEIQCAALGMQVEAWDDGGRPLPPGQPGELVCTVPFPNMPLGLLHDSQATRFRATYFERFPGVWHHGDRLELTPSGGAVIHGRSDTTLNPGGVRIGTAEIDRIVQRLPMIADCVVAGIPEEGDEAVVLCVVLRPGHQLTPALEQTIRQEIRQQASPRHVPRHIFAVDAIPYTVSGKKVEAAVRHLLRGEPVPNVSALANPEALEAYTRLLRRG